jgi:3-hydroxyisobutyrate dehydrogenase-like beta-hydroxyacid dehydrogenase
MGEPICRNITRKSAADVIAFDLDLAPLQRLSADGVRASDSVANVAAVADIIFLSLPGGPQVNAVVSGPAGILSVARSGQIVVDLSTTPVDLTRRLAALLSEKCVAYADAPVARTRQAAQDGTLSIMVGASKPIFDAISPLLAMAGSDVTHCGELGCGQIAKIMNNMMLVQIVVAISEALAIGVAAGIDGRLLLETLSKGSADSFALRNHGMKAILPGIFPRQAFSTRYAMKDLDCALALAKEANIQAPGAGLARELLARADAAGFGDEYFPAVSKVIAGLNRR